MNNEVKKPWLSRAAVPLMVLILVAPFLSAWIVFKYFPNAVRSLGTSNYGIFIDPPAKFSVKGLTDINGKPVAEDILNKNWTYVYFNSSVCDRTCFDHLMLIKNVRLSQGKEVSRMKRLFIISSGQVDASLMKTLKLFPTLHTVLLNNDEQRNRVRKIFTTRSGLDPFTSNTIYIVDPDGKVMMYYQGTQQQRVAETGMGKDAIIKLGKGMQDDMSKLMKNSTMRK